MDERYDKYDGVPKDMIGRTAAREITIGYE